MARQTETAQHCLSTSLGARMFFLFSCYALLCLFESNTVFAPLITPSSHCRAALVCTGKCANMSIYPQHHSDSICKRAPSHMLISFHLSHLLYFFKWALFYMLPPPHLPGFSSPHASPPFGRPVYHPPPQFALPCPLRLRLNPF